MPSLCLHRISVVRVYLSIAATTQDPAGRDLHQVRAIKSFINIYDVKCFNVAVKAIIYN